MSGTSEVSLNSPTTPVFSYELSPAQQRFWFIEKLYPDHPVNRLATSIRLVGPLEVALLTRCLTEVIQHHQVLRSAIWTEEGRPMAKVPSSTGLVMPLDDISSLPQSERDARSSEMVRAEIGRTLDLTEGSLLRAHLIKLGEAEHLLVLTAHRIIADRSALSMIIEEAFSSYADCVAGTQVSPPSAGIDWIEFVAQAREFRSHPTF